jgi:hypothetical protein
MTPDWENYCRLSRWTAENLPGNAVVACRKSSISFIYGNGRKFFGITRLPFSSGDSLVINWRRNNRHYYLIPADGLNNKPVSAKLSQEFNKGLAGYGMSVKNNFYEARFFLLDFEGPSKEETLRDLATAGIRMTDSPDSLEAWLREPGAEISMVYPDSVLRILYNAHVTHVITDNLRAFPDRKNEQTITTVARFMNFIDSKYPGIRTQVMQVGANDNEPASLFVINYEQAGLPSPR